MVQSRRDILKSIKVDRTMNASLWLDKYYNETDERGANGVTAKNQLVKEIANIIEPPDVYAAFYTRWKENLEQFGAVCKEAEVQGRLAINLGAEAVIETSIALHHTYGVPFIPGSALKGLASHYANKHLQSGDWANGAPAHKVLFGNTISAGYVTFFDALYVPSTGIKGKALWPDVTTVHHPDYYQSGDKPPADWDDPNPIPFLSATGRYLVALAGPAEKPEWVEKTFEILAYALEDEGIGAKTNSGYGRMIFVYANHEAERSLESNAAEEPYPLKRKRLLAENPRPGRYRGTVVEIRVVGTLAMINPARGGAKIAVHISEVKGSKPAIVVGQVVEYSLGKYRGEDQAKDVNILLWPEK